MEETIELENQPEPIENLTFEEIDSLVESLGKGDIFKKAKAIKKEHPDWAWSKCIQEAGKGEKKPEEEKKISEEKPEEKKPEDYYKEKKSELEEIIRNFKNELEKKKYPEPCSELKKKEEEPDEEKMALKKQLSELNDKFEEFKNKGFKTVRQPEELKEKTGITYLIGKDGSIMQDWTGYCGWK